MSKEIIWTDQDGDTITVYRSASAAPGYGLSLETRQGVTGKDVESLAGLVTLPSDTEEAVAFIKKLALALGLDAEVSPLDELGVCVEVAKALGDEDEWYVSGNIEDGLTQTERAAAERLLVSDDWDSFNYMMSRLITQNPGYGFADTSPDAESSGFFAYPKTEERARELAAWINGKSWLPK